MKSFKEFMTDKEEKVDVPVTSEEVPNEVPTEQEAPEVEPTED